MDNLRLLLQSKGPFFWFALPNEDETRRIEYGDFNTLTNTTCTLCPFSREVSGTFDWSVPKAEYLEVLRSVIADIKENKFEKMVLSRIIHVNRSPDQDISTYVERMMKAYPSSTVYVFLDPSKSLWMGATPEILFSRRGNRFTTMALAGTQAVVEGLELASYKWSDKEIHEHEVVVSYILQCLKRLGCEDVFIRERQSVIAGRVVHLRTIIQFSSDLSNAEIADLLHPTPAVGGIPVDMALEAIEKYEKHNREYYAGYLGLNYTNGDADYLVNLRCMQVHDDHYSIFVGSGITAGSDALKEWNETELKSRTLMDVINQE